MIEIRVSTDEEQAALGEVLAGGAIAFAFGDLPYKVTRLRPVTGSGGGGSGTAVNAGGNGRTAGGGGSAGSTASAGTAASWPGGSAGCAGGGAVQAGASWAGVPVFTEELRPCCATPAASAHLDGCDESPGYQPPEPARISAYSEHLASDCTGSGCRSEFCQPG